MEKRKGQTRIRFGLSFFVSFDVRYRKNEKNERKAEFLTLYKVEG